MVFNEEALMFHWVETGCESWQELFCLWENSYHGWIYKPSKTILGHVCSWGDVLDCSCEVLSSAHFTLVRCWLSRTLLPCPVCDKFLIKVAQQDEASQGMGTERCLVTMHFFLEPALELRILRKPLNRICYFWKMKSVVWILVYWE